MQYNLVMKKIKDVKAMNLVISSQNKLEEQGLKWVIENHKF